MSEFSFPDSDTEPIEYLQVLEHHLDEEPWDYEKLFSLLIYVSPKHLEWLKDNNKSLRAKILNLPHKVAQNIALEGAFYRRVFMDFPFELAMEVMNIALRDCSRIETMKSFARNMWWVSGYNFTRAEIDKLFLNAKKQTENHPELTVSQRRKLLILISEKHSRVLSKANS